jgi:hypothetical protein
MGSTRAVFAIYLVMTLAGLTLYILVGLTGN